MIGVGVGLTKAVAIREAGGPDVTPPATVSNLIIPFGWDVPSGSRLQCTAPGDDGMSGIAIEVAARWALSPITTEANWTAAGDLYFAGSSATWKSNGVAGGSEFNAELTQNPNVAVDKYIAIRFRDEAGNMGGISNNVVWTGSV